MLGVLWKPILMGIWTYDLCSTEWQLDSGRAQGFLGPGFITLDQHCFCRQSRRKEYTSIFSGKTVKEFVVIFHFPQQLWKWKVGKICSNNLLIKCMRTLHVGAGAKITKRFSGPFREKRNVLSHLISFFDTLPVRQVLCILLSTNIAYPKNKG